jgi:hypothetical protein
MWCEQGRRSLKLQPSVIYFRPRNRAHPVRGKGFSRLSQLSAVRLRTFGPLCGHGHSMEVVECWNTPISLSRTISSF